MHCADSKLLSSPASKFRVWMATNAYIYINVHLLTNLSVNPNCEVSKKSNFNGLICTGMTNYTGTNLKRLKHPCALCGLFEGAKVSCEEKDCGYPGAFYHVSCARQAGLQVDINIKDNGDMEYGLRCFTHSNGRFAFQAFLADLLVIETTRSPESSSFHDKWVHASRVFHQAVRIMRTLGWSWRWAEWWVTFGDNWTHSEGGFEVAECTPESRYDDATKCRLAEVGAALRNRNYDTEDGFDKESLTQALTEVLSIRSLAGPLKENEIDFLVQKLVLAYESKSPALGFGKDGTEVAKDAFFVYQEDGSPKYVLGSRELPGKIASQHGLSAPHVNEVDDFLKPSTPPIIRKRKLVEDSSSSRSNKSSKETNMSVRRDEANYGSEQGSGTGIATPATQSGSKRQHIPSEQTSPAMHLQVEQVAPEGSENNATSRVNGTKAKYISIGFRFSLLESHMGMYLSRNDKDGYDNKLAQLLDNLFVTVDHRNDNDFVNRAFGWVEQYREVYIAKRGPSVYLAKVAEFLMKLSWHDSYGSTFADFVDMLLANVNNDDISLINQTFDLMERHSRNLHLANVADFLCKRRGHASYNSKLVACLDRVLDIHNTDFYVIKQNFELLEASKDAYVATKGRDDYCKTIAVLIDRIFAGNIEDDDDEVIDEKFCLLIRHKDAYEEVRGKASYEINRLDLVGRIVNI